MHNTNTNEFQQQSATQKHKKALQKLSQQCHTITL